MEQFTRKCEWCEVEFTTPWETKAYCTIQHKERAHQFRKRGRRTQVLKTITIKFCKGCGLDFQTDNNQKSYCSSECRAWTTKQIKAERDKAYENIKTTSLKPRLYLRDAGICQICFTYIDANTKYPDPMSLSIDHIIPRSQGGNHLASNLRIAHLQCNINRGDKPA